MTAATTTPTTVGVQRSNRLASWSDNVWVRFAVRRLVRLVISLWVLLTASFGIIHLIPGDPVRASLGITAPVALVKAKRHALGLDDPLLVQYWHYLRGVFSGDLGTSLSSSLPVSQIISQRLPATAALAVFSFLLSIVVAIPLGAAMGVFTRGGRARVTELSFTTVSVVLAAIPDFLVAVVLVYVFGVHLHWLPVAGKSDWTSYVIPVVALAVGPAAVLARIVRVEMVGVLEADYVRTARAKRLKSRAVYFRHALPNALTTTITLGGLLLSTLVATTVLVENVVAWPGLGSTIVQSILAKDYPVVQGVVLVYGIGVLLVNLLVDVVLALLDPRSTIRES